jgi:hypothetical protein
VSVHIRYYSPPSPPSYNAPMMSSLMPSEKYSCSGSPLMS